MPRKGAVPKRDVLPDPVYGSKVVTRFINKVMLGALDTVGVAGRQQGRSKYGAKREKK